MITKNRPFKWIFALLFLASMSFSCSNAASENTESAETEVMAEPEESMEMEEMPPLDTTASVRPETIKS